MKRQSSRTPCGPARARRQRGVAAIELALILSFCALLAPTVVALAQLFYQYSALQNAVHRAARYMSSVPQSEMNNQAQIAALALQAQTMVTEAGIAAGLTGMRLGNVTVNCDASTCGYAGAAPVSITILARMTLEDSGLAASYYDLLGQSGFTLRVNASVRYGD